MDNEKPFYRWPILASSSSSANAAWWRFWVSATWELSSLSALSPRTGLFPTGSNSNWSLPASPTGSSPQMHNSWKKVMKAPPSCQNPKVGKIQFNFMPNSNFTLRPLDPPKKTGKLFRPKHYLFSHVILWPTGPMKECIGPSKMHLNFTM